MKRKIAKGWSVKKVKKKSRLSWFFGFVFFLFLLIVIFGFFSLILVERNLPDPDRLLQRSIPQSTRIYDRSGKVLLYEIFTQERRTLVSLSDIPQNLIYATIVIEDKDFFHHKGFSLKGIIRALIVDALHLRKVQGGSTITQQFIKNALLTPKKSYIRKIKELILAYQLEKKFSKTQILQMYFNEIPYGANAYGVEAASRIYFGKSVKDLTLDECALLAALPKAPTYYSPYGSHLEQLIKRRNYILDLMVEEGYITPEQAEKAKSTDTLKKIVPRRESILAPHFVMYVKEKLVEKYGQRMVEQGGLKVITTLDLEKQKIAEEEIKEQAKKNEKFNASNAALVALDVKTGQILAMVGSRDYFDDSIDGQVNVTIQPRQPGSSFKPIVYAAAFEKGYTPKTIVFDVKTNFGTSKEAYIPRNYDGKERGPVTLRKALAGSLNIPGVKVLYLTGIDNVLDLAEKMGYTTLKDRERYGLSLVLGGGEVTLLEHTAAYGIFARDGLKIPTTAILEVRDSQNNILEKFDKENIYPERVISKQVAREITDILSDNEARAFMFGKRSPLYLENRPAAVKTGTTNNWRDAWTIGYTPNLVCGVWVGNNDNSEMKEKASGLTVAAPIWHKFMIRALENKPIENFTPPEPRDTKKPILNGEIPGVIKVKIDKASGKLATDLTPASYIVEKTYRIYHSILYFVDKDNPQGPRPKNPENDPQFENWEKGIKDWMKRNNIKEEKPPTEYDNLHTLANKPKVELIFPKDNTIINKRVLNLEFFAQAPRGIKKVKCLIDDKIANLTYQSSNCKVNLTGLKYGEHKIKVVAYDDIDNNNFSEITVFLKNIYTPTIIWLSPENNQIVYQNDFPLILTILTPPIKIKEIRYFSLNLDSQKKEILGEVKNPKEAGRFNLIWPSTASGRYQLWSEAIGENGEKITSEKINLIIY